MHYQVVSADHLYFNSRPSQEVRRKLEIKAFSTLFISTHVPHKRYDMLYQVVSADHLYFNSRTSQEVRQQMWTSHRLE